MNKIDIIEDNEIPIKSAELNLESSASLPWREYLKVKGLVKEEQESLEEMCVKCIKKQKADHGMVKIKCTGLAKPENFLGTEIYEEMSRTVDEETVKSIEMIYNPITWINNVIKDEEGADKMFDPRWYQTKILNCTATRKVLRMGRRCIDGEEKIKGEKKNYSVKHLFHLAKHHKKLPKIFTYNMETLEGEYTDKYYLVPNPETNLIEFTFEDHTTLKVTMEHPILIYKDKQFYFEEAINVTPLDSVIRTDSSMLKVKSRKVVKNRQTYHLTVVGTHTFATSNGVVQHNTGKALDINTPIPTPNGWTTMEFVKEGDQVFDDAGNTCNVTFATDIQYDRKCYEIEFDNGDKIVADEDHQWNVSTRNSRRKDPTLEKTVTTKDILDYKGKYYGIRLTEPVNYPAKDLKIDPYMLGFWLGDGRSSDGRLTIGDEDSSEIISLLQKRGYEIKKLSDKYMYSVKGLTTSLRALSLLNNKHIPIEYLQSDVTQRLELLRGLMDSDGSFLSRDKNMEFTTSLENLSEDFKDLIKSLGIKTTRHRNKSFLNGKNCKDRFRFTFKTHLKVFNLNRKDKNEKVQTYSRSNFLYINSIKPVESRPVKCISVDSPKNLYLAGKEYIVTHNTASMTVGLLHRLLTNNDYKVLMVAPMQTMIDEVYDTVLKYCSKMEGKKILSNKTTPTHEINFDTGSSFKGVTAGAQGAKGTRGKGANLIYVDECLVEFTRIVMSDGRTKAIVDVDEGDYVSSYDVETGKFVPKRVLAVKYTGVKEVFKYKTISGKTITATSNHPVLTSEGWKPLHEAKDIAVPHKKLFDVFYETIVGRVSKGLQKVYNLTVEGTHVYIANNMVVHNCDFLGTKDMTSITAILADKVDTEFWASSTPMGERNLFNLAKNPRYKEFHYPTYVSPTYNDDTDEDFRMTMDTTGIIQEVLAEFGADDSMAFQLHFIENCILDSEEEIDVDLVLQRRKDYDIAIGVDWNKAKVGTRILVVARGKRDKKLLIVDKHRISAADRTQLVAVQAVKDLNRKWTPDFIYVDEGHGEAQGADLREEGAKALESNDMTNPDIRLLDVQSIQFGSSLTIKDHNTGKEFRKQAKNYMVELLNKTLQTGSIVLQESLDQNIIAQLKNYCIISQSVSGLRVYGAREKVKIGDHDLDALMLANFAFKMNLDDGYNTGISFTPIINTKEDVGFVTNTVDKKDLVDTSEHFYMNKNSTRRAGGRKAFKARSKW